MQEVTARMVLEAAIYARQNTAEGITNYGLIAKRLNEQLKAQHNAMVDRHLWRGLCAAGVLDVSGLTLLLLNNQVGWAAIFGGLFAILLVVAWIRS